MVGACRGWVRLFAKHAAVCAMTLMQLEVQRTELLQDKAFRCSARSVVTVVSAKGAGGAGSASQQ
eukprot:999370-Pelagomonas_calceolata.AAC.4